MNNQVFVKLARNVISTYIFKPKKRRPEVSKNASRGIKQVIKRNIGIKVKKDNMGWGGKRTNAGRKAKADELQLLEKLSPMEDLSLQVLEDGLKKEIISLHSYTLITFMVNQKKRRI